MFQKSRKLFEKFQNFKFFRCAQWASNQKAYPNWKQVRLASRKWDRLDGLMLVDQIVTSKRHLQLIGYRWKRQLRQKTRFKVWTIDLVPMKQQRGSSSTFIRATVGDNYSNFKIYWALNGRQKNLTDNSLAYRWEVGASGNRRGTNHKWHVCYE